MRILIKGARVTPVTTPEFTGDILLENGIIKALGQNLNLEADTVLEAEGFFVYPGIIEEHCHIGVHGEKTNQKTDDDVNEWADPATAEVHALDGIKPFDYGFKYAIAAGVTTLNIFPGSANPFGGIGTTLKNDMKVHFEDRILLKESGFKMAMGENPKKVHSSVSKTIMTRMGTASVIRKNFQDAINYKNKKDKEFNPKFETLLKVLDKELTVHCHAHKAEDIMTIIRISEEFGFKLSLEHATESHLIADILAEKEIPLAVGPMFTSRYKMEVNNRTIRTPGILEKAGVEKLTLITDHPVIPINNLPIEAALAMANGLSREMALKSITINPAKNLGIQNRVGSLEVGKDADVIITEREILDPTHVVMYTIVNGKIQYSMKEEGLIL